MCMFIYLCVCVGRGGRGGGGKGREGIVCVWSVYDGARNYVRHQPVFTCVHVFVVARDH